MRVPGLIGTKEVQKSNTGRPHNFKEVAVIAHAPDNVKPVHFKLIEHGDCCKPEGT